MQCRSCGAETRADDHFCNVCGARVSDGPEPTPPSAGPTSSPPPPPAPAQPEATEVDPTNEMALPSLYDLADEIDPDVADALAALARGEPDPFSDDPSLDLPEVPTDPGTLEQDTDPQPGPPPPPPPPPPPDTTDESTTVLPQTPAPSGDEPTTRLPTTAPTSPHSTNVMATTPAQRTGQVPASYAPIAVPDAATGDRAELGARRFRLRLVFFVAILAAVAALATTGLDIIEITTDDPSQGFPIGIWELNDFGTNNTVAMAVAVGVMVVGAFLACFRYRWGGGLAGGAGLAIAGWSALMIGAAELRFAPAETRLDQSNQAFVVTFTRDWGYWFLVAAGGLGVLVFLTSLTSIRRDAATNLNPWVAALGAVATLVAAAGPLLPEGDFSIENNWTSIEGGLDIPTLYFAGRLAQLGVLALAGVIGFLLMRRYGLGLAAGAFTVFAWLTITALLERTDSPIGPAIENPGAENTVPHAVTVGGLALALFCLLIAAIEVALHARPGDDYR